MSHQAPALGGASTSQAQPFPSLHSAWNPYAVLPPATKRKIDPRSSIPSRPYLETLSIPQDVATERIANKYLQLDPPEGRMSDRRKAELATKTAEKEKRRVKRAREGECGLIGRKKRLSLGKQAEHRISYAAILPVHHLWLGYMAELLQLPILLPPSSADSSPVSTTSMIYPAFPSRQAVSTPNAVDLLPLNVATLHTKLTKAEFVGSRLQVKRAKNPSLIGLDGIVLQETQGTFKLVTVKSKVKVLPKEGTIFTLDLPLAPNVDSNSVELPASRSVSFDIYGDAFAFRSADRVGRKWKAGTSAGRVELI